MPVRTRLAPLLVLVLAASACGGQTPSPSATPATSPSAAAEASTPPATSAPPSASPGSACAPATAATSKDWNQRVWYEVFVRSFADGNGDGIGDLRGLTAKLDYLNDGDPSTTTDLGIGGLWLMPVMASPSYHGYDVVDYRRIEQDYGTSADFKAFLAAAHERGIKVILDLVLNHTSSQNPWFVDAQTPGSKHDDWYVWSKTNPAYLGPDGQVVWHQDGNRWFYGVFSDQMPDLNYRTPAVTAAVEDIARFWLSDVGVDGFRLDAAKHLIEDGRQQVNTPETLAWLAGFKASVDADKPGSLLIGEVWDTPQTAGRYVPGSLDMTFDFGLATGTELAIQQGRAAPLVTGLSDTIASWPANQEGTFLTNHDQTRIINQLNGDVPSAKLAAFMLLTEPGVPFVYYGEEIGMSGAKPDERIRTPMRWTADAASAGFTTGQPWEELSGDPASVNVASESADPASLLSVYRDLIRVHTANEALRVGTTTIVDGGAEPVIGWLRTTPGQTLLSVVNTSDAPVESYGLTLRDGPLCGALTARLLATVGGDAGASLGMPTVTASGGLDAWQPVPVLAPRSGYLISLEPVP